MAVYVQYDATGFILATYSGFSANRGETVPDVDGVTRWQAEFPDETNTQGKMIDFETQQLVDAPPTE